MSDQSILIVEDDPLVGESLCEVLKREGYRVTHAESGEQAMALLEQNIFQVAMIDLRLPRMTGIDFLRHIRVKYTNIECLMMTSFATVETAVEAMRIGAVDYVTKPINDDELRLLMRKIFDTQNLRTENINLKKELSDKRGSFHNLIGANPKMQRIYSIIEAIRDTQTTILLKGESGTGKGMIAQAIHSANPDRKNGPYIEVSCGAIPRELLESELFGHVKGAFTSAIRDRIGRFEMANGGTILLDEIDSIPPYLQVKLLRILQQKTFEMVGDTKTKSTDVRIIAATNRNLEEEIRKGNFREDLYYRLNVITIDVPPLRDRKDDIPALVRHFINNFNQKIPRNIKGITKEAMKVLLDYDWPGNIRELENTLERIVVLSQKDLVGIEDIPEHLIPSGMTTSGEGSHGLNRNLTLKDGLREPEKKIIVQALEQSGWNRKKAALLLDINRTTLYNKMKEYQLL